MAKIMYVPENGSRRRSTGLVGGTPAAERCLVEIDSLLG